MLNSVIISYYVEDVEKNQPAPDRTKPTYSRSHLATLMHRLTSLPNVNSGSLALFPKSADVNKCRVPYLKIDSL